MSEGEIVKVPMESLPITLEAGKTYMMANGYPWRCYAVDGNGTHCAHGASNRGFGWERPTSRSIYGDLPVGMPWMPSWECRIIGIYEPQVRWDTLPAWIEWVVQDSDGIWSMAVNEPTPLLNSWSITGEWYARIPDAYAPTWNGRWQDSKIRRPHPAPFNTVTGTRGQS